jgi:hypothetical protein
VSLTFSPVVIIVPLLISDTDLMFLEDVLGNLNSIVKVFNKTYPCEESHFDTGGKDILGF